MGTSRNGEYLRYWLVTCAALRALSVYIGYFQHDRIFSNIYDLTSEQAVTPLLGRVFANWTILSGLCCLFLARDLYNKSLFFFTGATFAHAGIHFTLELLYFRTMTLRSFLSPAIAWGVSLVWLTTFWFSGGLENPPPPKELKKK